MWSHLSSGKNAWGVPQVVADGPKLDPDGDGVLKHVQGRQVQFADTDGDGRLDYVVVGTVTGRSWTWHNLGFQSDGSIRWNTVLPFADGPGTGRRGAGVRIVDVSQSPINSASAFNRKLMAPSLTWGVYYVLR